MKSIYGVDLEAKCTYKKMPPQVKQYLLEVLGKEETRKLMHALRTRKLIVIGGPESSGKSTIKYILESLGYPYVVDGNGLTQIVCTSKKLDKWIPTSEIFEKLGIDLKR